MLKFYKKGKDEVPVSLDLELQNYNQTSHEGTDTTETINKGLNNNALEQQLLLSNDSPDNIIVVYDETVESGKPYEDEDLSKERLKSSITNLYRPQSATSSVPITDDTNVTSPSADLASDERNESHIDHKLGI